MKVKLWIIASVAIFILFQTAAFIKIYDDNRRLSDNFMALSEGTKYFRLNDSISAARSQMLLLDNAEIKKLFPEIKKNIELLDLKLRQLERYSAVGSEAQYYLATKIYEDLQDLRENQDLSGQADLNATLFFPVKYTVYKDKWIDFQQRIIADSAYTNIQTRDSIAIVQNWQRPHKFWFVKWGRKQHFQTVLNFNPYSTITYSIYVKKQ